jgi:hypothetical protein
MPVIHGALLANVCESSFLISGWSLSQPLAGPAVFIVPMDRYHQNAEKGDILGEVQWKWLEDILMNNDADVTLIDSGIQVIYCLMMTANK